MSEIPPYYPDWKARQDAEARVAELEAALREIKTEAGGNSGENTYKMNGRLLRILNTAHDALKGQRAE